MGKKVTVQIVTYNSEKDILKCLDSIRKQTYKNFEVIVIDNKSTDNTVDLFKKESSYSKLILNTENTGFCKGHNIGFKEGTGEYVMVLNPDVVLDKNFFEEVVNEMEKDSKIGLISGKILRMSYQFTPTNIIDSTGIILPRNKRAYDRGQGEEDLGQYDEKRDIFGVCGAAAVYKREMLEDIKIDDEYFDENFFAYKEDVDLSWRARLFGWKCKYVPAAIAYHHRGWKKSSRKDQPTWLKIHSIKNRYLMIIKNEKFINLIKNIPWLLVTDVGIFFYCLFKEPQTLRYIIETVKLIPSTLKKRKIIQKKARSIR